jgi:hypothetical protein
MRKIALWDFDRILLCHGEIVETGGQEKFASAYL